MARWASGIVAARNCGAARMQMMISMRGRRGGARRSERSGKQRRRHIPAAAAGRLACWAARAHLVIVNSALAVHIDSLRGARRAVEQTSTKDFRSWCSR